MAATRGTRTRRRWCAAARPGRTRSQLASGTARSSKRNQLDRHPAGQGNPYAGYPWLAGQHATYTASMLNKYRDGTQWGADDANSAVMVGVAKRLSDEEIAAVASYIEGLHRAD